MGYGVVQPFLPAALIANGNWVWRIIALWRALGWTIMLIFLLYAPLRAVKNLRKTFTAAGLSVLVWIGIRTAAGALGLTGLCARFLFGLGLVAVG